MAEVAAAVGWSVSLAHYHVQRLLHLRLLRRAGERQRAGRPIRLYQSTADAYFVSDSLQRTAPGQNLQAELDGLLEARRSRDIASGTLFARASDGGWCSAAFGAP